MLRWGLIGASDMAASWMLPALRGVGHPVAAVMSSSAERGRAYAQRHGIPFATDDLDALFDRVDAVYISTTNDLHHPQTLAAAAAGKHVLCEKPLALSLAQAREMIDACADAGVVLATNHHLPAAATVRAIGDAVRAGAIGEPLAVRAFQAVRLPDRLSGWRQASSERGGGVILDITTHNASAVNAVLGRAALEATAIAVRKGPPPGTTEDDVVTALRYDGDIVVQTHEAYTIRFAGTGLEVHGTDGSVVGVDTMTQEPIGRVLVRTASGERELAVQHQNMYEATLTAFAAATRGEGRPYVDGNDGARALAVALAVKEAAAGGRTVPVADV